MTEALGLLDRRLLQARGIAESVPLGSEEWTRDFAEILRHELNNPLTGILGNAELLLAEISRINDGRLPSGGLERVETIAALAMRMRETVRQLSQTMGIASRSGAIGLELRANVIKLPDDRAAGRSNFTAIMEGSGRAGQSLVERAKRWTGGKSGHRPEAWRNATLPVTLDRTTAGNARFRAAKRSHGKCHRK